MQIKLWKLGARLENLLSIEEGQDLIEYALVVALIAFAAVTSMQSLASDINNAFANIGNSLVSSI